MKIVIDIPKEIYKETLKTDAWDEFEKRTIRFAIHNGTPVPKGQRVYGDLITKEQAIELIEFYQMNPQHFNFVDLIDEIKAEKAIIEADN